LPVRYKIHLAYLPDGIAVGLSKLARVAALTGARSTLQEELTSELARDLEYVLETEDVAVVIYGQHMCMQVRGVRAGDATTVTSLMRGKFLTNDAGLKDEFLREIGR
jgi:GTP cyclohydrolase IA